MSKQPPSAPTASAIGPCPTIIQSVGRPGTGNLLRTIAPPDHPLVYPKSNYQTTQFEYQAYRSRVLKSLTFWLYKNSNGALVSTSGVVPLFPDILLLLKVSPLLSAHPVLVCRPF